MSGGFLWTRLTEEAELYSQAMPRQSLVEILGNSRVLIENHLGVQGYDREKIMVKVHLGTVTICGSCMEMVRMTKEQLVICGHIDSISLQGGRPR